MSAEDLRDEFLNRLNHFTSVFAKIRTNSGPGQILSAPDLHKLTEGLFLSAWTHWEQFTHYLLIEDVATRTTSKLNREVTTFRTTGAAYRLANQLLTHPDHPKKFIDWSDYGSVESRANEFLGAGNRFAAPPLARRADLESLKRIRNAIAHRTDKAWGSFMRLCRDAPFSLTPARMRGITPGRFLATQTWNGHPVLTDTFLILENAARHLVP